MGRRLSLHAQDEGDLAVIAACLQDAQVRRRDMAWLRRERRFAFLASRCLWEENPGSGACDGRRVVAGVHFDGVLAVQSRGLPADDDAVLELLTIGVQPGAPPAASIALLFQGGAEVRLDVECIEAALRDVAEPAEAVQ
jgi:hypothetical protein